MANTVQITLEGFNKFDKAFNDLKAQLGQVTGEVKKMDTGLGAVTSSTQGLLKGFTGLYAAKQVFDLITASIKNSLEYMGKMETSALGIAASFLTQGKYIDETTGKALKGQEALTAAQEDTKAVLKELQVANFETIATLDQLVRIYQETLPVAMAKGFDRQQIKDFTLAVVQAAGALGVPLDMLGEETRSMLTGAINPRTSRIATALGITPEIIAALKGDAKKLFEYLIGMLEGFRTAGIASQTTWNGLWSNMKDMALMVGGQVLEPLFNTIKTALIDIQKYIMDIDETTGKVKGFSPEFLENIKTARRMLGYIVADLIGVVAAFDIAGTKLGEQAFKMAERVKHPIKAIKNMYFTESGDEGFPESTIPGKAIYYGNLVNQALGKNDQPEKASGKTPPYNPNPPPPGEDKEAKKLADSWNKTARDLTTDLSQLNVDEFDKKIAEYENKAADMMEKFKTVKGAAEEIGKWLTGMKGNELEKYEKKNNEAILKASTDAAKERYAVIESSEKFITERIKTELDKRLADEERAGQEQIAKLAGQLAAMNISEEEYAARSTAIREASKKRQLEITTDYNRQILEAETSHQLALLNAAEKDMTMSRADVTRGRVEAQTTLLGLYNAELQKSIENNDTLARMGWQEKIDATNVSLTEQNRLLQEQTGTFQGGLIEALREYAYNMETAFQFGKQAIIDTAQALEGTFKSAFGSIRKGTFDLKETLLNLCDSMSAAVENMLAKMLTNWIMTGNAMQAADSGGSMGGLMGLLGSLFGGLSGGGGSPSLISDGAGGFYRQGGIFDSAGLKPYLNTVVSKPTMFKFAHGMGMMGEAGDEAIMPLTRTPSGDLGVRSIGGGSQGSVTINQFHITTMDSKSLDAYVREHEAVFVGSVTRGLQGNNYGLRNLIKRTR